MQRKIHFYSAESRQNKTIDQILAHKNALPVQKMHISSFLENLYHGDGSFDILYTLSSFG